MKLLNKTVSLPKNIFAIAERRMAEIEAEDGDRMPFSRYVRGLILDDAKPKNGDEARRRNT